MAKPLVPSTCRLIYISEPSSAHGPFVLAGILREARARNWLEGVTGLLCFAERFFLQVLEGPPTKVNEVFLRIARDPRHRRVKLLAYDETDAREYAEWPMAFVLCGAEQRAVLDRLGVDSDDPVSSFDAAAAHSLLREARAVAGRVDLPAPR